MQREVTAPLLSKIWSNVGETRNTGVELSITSRNFVGPEFNGAPHWHSQPTKKK